MAHPDARRRAFRAVEETCPIVDREAERVGDALDEMVKRIKSDCTEALREALIDAFDQVIELEGERDELQERVEELEGELEQAQRAQQEAS